MFAAQELPHVGLKRQLTTETIQRVFTEILKNSDSCKIVGIIQQSNAMKMCTSLQPFEEMQLLQNKANRKKTWIITSRNCTVSFVKVESVTKQD